MEIAICRRHNALSHPQAVVAGTNEAASWPVSFCVFCELLAPVYGWFTEGFDTLDLKEAKALLDELHA